MQRAACLLLLILLGVPARADEHKASTPLTKEQAADAVIAAYGAKDDAALKALAEQDDPDPWFVADLLCRQGDMDVAAAYARAAPRKTIEALPAYVASRRDAKGVLLSPLTVIRGQYGLAMILRRRGNAIRSAKTYIAAGEAARKLGWLVGAARALGEGGQLALDHEEPELALSARTSELAIRRLVGDQPSIAGALTNVALARAGVGDLVGAIEDSQASIEINRGLGGLDRRTNIAVGKNNLGMFEARLGNWDRALQLYEEGLAIPERSRHQDLTASLLHNTGQVHLKMGHLAQGLRSLESALAESRNVNNQRIMARVRVDLGNAYRDIRKPAMARLQYEAALEAHRLSGSRSGVSYVRTQLGVLAGVQGEHAAALEHLETALASYVKRDDRPGIAMVHAHLGMLHQRVGEPDAALANYEKSLEIWRALDNANRAAQLLRSIGAMRGNRGDLAAARLAFEEATTLAARGADPGQMANVATGVAWVLLKEGSPAQAMAPARQAVKFYNSRAGGLAEGEGAEALDAWEGSFEVGCLAATRADDAHALLWFLETGRANSLREGLGSRRALQIAVIPPALQRALSLAQHAERRAVAAYRGALGGSLKGVVAARKRWLEAQTRTAHASARVEREAKAAAKAALTGPDEMEQIQKGLRPGEALLLYGLMAEESVALVVERAHVRVVPLAEERKIAAATAAVLGGPKFVTQEALPALRKLVIDPLALSDEVRRVLVSPAGHLSYIPFCLLFPDKEIAYAPSGTTHGILLADRELRGQQILAFGDPDYDTNPDTVARKLNRGATLRRLRRLPATREEVRQVADVTRLGARATETELQDVVKTQERWRAVHFACHGLLNPETPLLSSLALTSDAENDGFLSALEIFRMKIPADLVVLSACETGKGKIYKTEGIVGMTRAFMFAGAPRVICSLWKVPDEATSALMVKFYEKWNPKDGKGLGAAAALKEAQAFIRDHPKHPEWKHPYYWAAWVLWGLPD